jgi:hypothetical protein
VGLYKEGAPCSIGEWRERPYHRVDNNSPIAMAKHLHTPLQHGDLRTPYIAFVFSVDAALFISDSRFFVTTLGA